MRNKVIPLREISFAAKTGFLSKSLWHEFYTRRSRSRNCRLWNRFVADGWFRPHDSKMLPNVLVLGKRALAELERRGVCAVTKPHLGQFDHDEKAARIILSLEQENVIENYHTEAELKRKFMVWMKTDKEGKNTKFPDLTIMLKGPSKFRRIAIEIEQSVKSFERYKRVMNSYASAKEIDAVIFVSDQQTIFNRIARAMKETHYPSWERPVGFGEMAAWLANPFDAPIYFSREVASIRAWMREVHLRPA